MGKVLVPIRIENLQEPHNHIEVEAFVDTAAAYLTLPNSWKNKLGPLRKIRSVQTQFADQKSGRAEVYAPVALKIKGFEEIVTEVLFLDMLPDEQGTFEPLLGYIPLEQANAVIDMQKRKLERSPKIMTRTKRAALFPVALFRPEGETPGGTIFRANNI